MQRRLIDAVKVNDILIAGGIFLLKFRKGTASAVLKGKAVALQRNPPINGKLERPFAQLWKPVAGVFLGAGVLIGVGGSLSAIRRFLQV